eukprot:5957098-Lingulodinium_polyedra.AAC.1
MFAGSNAVLPNPTLRRRAQVCLPGPLQRCRVQICLAKPYPVSPGPNPGTAATDTAPGVGTS